MLEDIAYNPTSVFEEQDIKDLTVLIEQNASQNYAYIFTKNTIPCGRSLPCLNGVSCENDGAGKYCVCSPGFTGDNCA